MTTRRIKTILTVTFFVASAVARADSLRVRPLGSGAVLAKSVGSTRFEIRSEDEPETARWDALLEGLDLPLVRGIALVGNLSPDGDRLVAGELALGAREVAELIEKNGAPLYGLGMEMENPGPYDLVDGADAIVFLGGNGPFAAELAAVLNKPVIVPRGKLELRTDVGAGALLGLWVEHVDGEPAWEIVGASGEKQQALVRELEKIEERSREAKVEVVTEKGTSFVPVRELGADTVTVLPRRTEDSSLKGAIENLMWRGIEEGAAYQAQSFVEKLGKKIGLPNTGQWLGSKIAAPLGRKAVKLACDFGYLAPKTP